VSSKARNYALELVKDKETRETFTDDECQWLGRQPALAQS
jgi:hypothetical protein